jgi:hypothetical protein
MTRPQAKRRDQAHAHHYVPQWYQKRFLLPRQTKFFYLDLHPGATVHNGVDHAHKELHSWGPKKCFYEDDLYTLTFGQRTTDEMERRFFGEIDRCGRDAVLRFAALKGPAGGTGDAFNGLTRYMSAQRFRTPRGLDEIRKRASCAAEGQNATLAVMRDVFQAYETMWTEGIWEIARAEQSATKFIVTDDPVTFYCKSMFASEWTYPDDCSLKQIGTRTLFPLGLDSCLVVTHMQLALNPWATPTEYRVNPRFFDQTMVLLDNIQFGRELEEDEVLRINYILKKRATRYIAAAKEEWLYPERYASTTEWKELDHDWFLLPHLWRVPFTTSVVAGSLTGLPWSVDEYGLKRWQPGYQDKNRRSKEHVTCDRGKLEWAKRRAGKSIARDGSDHGHVTARMMQEYLEAEGLRSKQAAHGKLV